MGIVNADVAELLQSCNNIKTAITSIEATRSSMMRKYQQLNGEWKDKKYKELGDVVQECCKALNEVLKILSKGERFVSLLANSLQEYHSVNLDSLKSTDNAFVQNLRNMSNSSESFGVSGVNSLQNRRISTGEQSQRWKSSVEFVNNMLDNYRTELLARGVYDGSMLERFLATQRAQMLEYEGQVLEVESRNRPELNDDEIFQYVQVGENSPYSYADLANDFSVFCMNDIRSWITKINPNPNNDPRRNVNCGKCAAAVFMRLNGSNDASAGLGTYSIQEMNSITGLTQTSMTPSEIENYLINQGAGSHCVVGVDRATGSGHWFNAFYDGHQIYTIEGQGGIIDGWPPDYGNVVHWDASI